MKQYDQRNSQAAQPIKSRYSHGFSAHRFVHANYVASGRASFNAPDRAGFVSFRQAMLKEKRLAADDAKASGGIFAIDHDKIELPFGAQAGQLAANRRATGAAKNITVKKGRMRISEFEIWRFQQENFV